MAHPVCLGWTRLRRSGTDLALSVAHNAPRAAARGRVVVGGVSEVGGLLEALGTQMIDQTSVYRGVPGSGHRAMARRMQDGPWWVTRC